MVVLAVFSVTGLWFWGFLPAFWWVLVWLCWPHLAGVVSVCLGWFFHQGRHLFFLPFLSCFSLCSIAVFLGSMCVLSGLAVGFLLAITLLGFGVFCIYSTPCICSSFYPAWCVLHGLEVIILIV